MIAAVTGASGHIGNNLCRELLNRGYKVRALVRGSSESLKGLDLELVPGDMSNDSSLQKLVAKVDVVFHLAAVISIGSNSRDALQSVNIGGTTRIAEISLKKKIPRFVHFSSIHALDRYPLEFTMTEENPLVDLSAHPYDQSKAEAERIVLQAVGKGLSAVIVNPTSVIGPNDFRPSFIGRAIIALANGTIPALVPGGFDWVDVRDVVTGALQAAERGRDGQRYLLSGYWKELRDFARAIVSSRKHSLPPTIPYFLARLGLPFVNLFHRLGGPAPLYTAESLDILKETNRNISSEKAEKELGYTKRPFEETMNDCLSWYGQQGMINSK